MNPEKLFEKFPDLLFSGFRQQMLLGKVPADVVQQILEPLLSNFQDIMFQLPSDLQADLENVLRIYPDVAERFGVWIKPPVALSLRGFARRRKENYQDLDMAAEPQQGFQVTKKSFVSSFPEEGQGFFTTDRGNPVYIEFSSSEAGDFACFEYKPPRFAIEIRICGRCAATLTPDSPRQLIPADRLSQILAECTGEIEIRIIELT
ncbi:MAG: hypothetical protein ACP5SH_16350 [Syntrophobacteraceae bacterium]